MLRTNSKKAKENVRDYIMKWETLEEYGFNHTMPFPQTASAILKIFRSEKEYCFGHLVPEYAIFEDWTRGLPSALNCCYWWFNRSAVDDLGEILEETEEERSKYSEEEAGILLTKLIYRELINGENELK